MDLWPPANYRVGFPLRFHLIEVPLFRLWGALLPQRPRGLVRSFNQEHSYIEEWVRRHELETVHWVDIGAGDGIDMSNTYALAAAGHPGLAIEGSPLRFAQLSQNYRRFPQVALARRFVEVGTIADLLAGFGVPSAVDVVSLAIDGFDLHIAKAVMDRFRPRLWVVEWNPIIPPGIGFSVDPVADFRWQVGWLAGCSLSAWAAFASQHDYAMTRAQGAALYLEDLHDPLSRSGQSVEELWHQYQSDSTGVHLEPPQGWPDLMHLSQDDAVAFLSEQIRGTGQSGSVWAELGS